jgi:hypothetical protein
MEFCTSNYKPFSQFVKGDCEKKDNKFFERCNSFFIVSGHEKRTALAVLFYLTSQSSCPDFSIIFLDQMQDLRLQRQHPADIQRVPRAVGLSLHPIQAVDTENGGGKLLKKRPAGRFFSVRGAGMEGGVLSRGNAEIQG